MKNIFTKDATGIAILIVIMVVGGLILSGESGTGDRTVGSETVNNPSIYNDRASGVRAFFEWTGKLGRRTQVNRADWSTLPGSAAMLVSIAPTTAPKVMTVVTGTAKADPSALTEADGHNVAKWIAAGHTFLLMTSDLPGPVSSGGTDSAAFGEALGLDVSSGIGSMPKFYAPAAPLALTSGVNAIQVAPGARVLRNTDDEVTLFGVPPSASGTGPVKGEPVVLMFDLGKGHVVVIADSEFASNANLPRADNAAFLANIVNAYTNPGDIVLFDEYHHGDIDDDSGIWQVIGTPIQLGLIQAGLAAIILLIVLAPRFGAPIVVAGRVRRTSGEYVTSLAGLYRNARATVPALEIVYKQFLRDMCARLALPPDVSLEQLSDAAARRANLNKVNLRRLLGNCERALDQQTLTESDLLELVRQMERFRKDLGID